MRTILIASVFAAGLSSAFAQGAPPAQIPNNDAVDSSGGTNSNEPGGNQPLESANSFTQDQAESRLEAQGYMTVGPLNRDGQGIWHGRAVKDGRALNVSVDFQGRVLEQ